MLRLPRCGSKTDPDRTVETSTHEISVGLVDIILDDLEVRFEFRELRAGLLAFFSCSYNDITS